MSRRWAASGGLWRLLLEQQQAGSSMGAAPSRLVRSALQAEVGAMALRHSWHSAAAAAAESQLWRQLLPAAALPLQQQARGLHSSASWGLAPLQQDTAVKTKLAHPPVVAVPPGQQVPLRQVDASRTAPSLADAEECDEALEELHDTRRRVRLTRLAPGQVPLKARVRHAALAVQHGVRFTLQFLVSVPGRLQRFAALPREQRRQTYAHWWGVVKKEAKHYWVGTKLLAADVRIASRLALKVLKGCTLSRRERNQLTRTMADIFRLVPMLVFVLVPFMELLLPVALKLFPNMLPSTFEDKLKKEEELKRHISARLEVARFLQDTVTEMAQDMQKSSRSGEVKASAAELYRFMQQIRAGKTIPTSELLKFAKLFNDELTLDNLERVQLVSLCRFVGIQPFGTDTFLRGRLRRHLQEIKEDDREIQEEGLETLTEDELRQACRARGMRAPFGEGAAAFMREQLAEWLDWSLNRSLPSSLLLLSRAFTVTQPVGAGPRKAVDVKSLREVLSTLPDEAVEDVELFETESADKTDAYERKLELLEREEEMIREEEEEAAVAAEIPLTAGKADARQMAAAAAAAAVVHEAAAAALHDGLEGQSAEEKAALAAERKQAKMRKVITALAALASTSGVASEREEFMQLVEKEIGRLEGQLEKRGVGMVFTRGALATQREGMQEMVGAKRLEDRVVSILQRVERELDEADHKIGEKLHVLDLDGDGVISVEEVQAAMSFLRQQMGEEELRGMLNLLSEEAGTGVGSIDVNKLLELAGLGDDSDEED